MCMRKKIMYTPGRFAKGPAMNNRLSFRVLFCGYFCNFCKKKKKNSNTGHLLRRQVSVKIR